jgi:hypothetical protein
MVELKVVDIEDDDDDDDIELLPKSTENRLVSTLTSSKATISIELIKVFLLFVICIVVGLVLAIRTHTTTVVQNAQVVPLGDPTIPTQLLGNSTQLPAPTNWEYKVVSWKSDYYQGCTNVIGWREEDPAEGVHCYCGEPPVGDVPPIYGVPLGSCKTANLTCSHCGGAGGSSGGDLGYPRSNSSFVDVALREGLTNEDIFNTCSFPTRTRVMNTYGQNHVGAAITTSENATFALPISNVERKISDCVIEMLINMLKRDNWSLLPSPNAETLHFSNKPAAPTQLPAIPTQPPAIPTQPPAPTNWEYKLVLWDSTYVEDCQATSQKWNALQSSKRPRDQTPVGEYCYYGDSMCNAEIGSDVIDPSRTNDDATRFGLVPPSDKPCNPCGPQSGDYGSFESKSSFVNTALKEGLTRDELFTECYYPTMSRTINYWGRCYSDGSCGWGDLTEEQYGASHYNFTPPTITVGESLEVVELEVVSCVMEKLVNRIAEGGWEFIPSPSMDSLYFRRQKV